MYNFPCIKQRYIYFFFTAGSLVQIINVSLDSDSLIQIGGSDQLGNISAGQELISRALDKQV